MSIANIAKFHLPGKATQEELECNWSKVVRFGSTIIVAGYYFMGRGKPSYFAAIYECDESKFSCEDVLECTWVSDVMYEDDGHAILDAIRAMTLPGNIYFKNPNAVPA